MEAEYSKNDVIRFMTNEPQAHVVEMFGHCEFNPDDIQKEEYTGRIKGVIDNGRAYLVTTLSPMEGFICIASAADIIRQVSLEELSAKELSKYNERLEWMETPNVYINDASGIDRQNCDEAKACEQAASNAMKFLFPEQRVVGVKKEKDSWFTTEWYLHNMDYFLKDIPKDNPEYAELKKRRDFLADIVAQARFKQYHSVMVSVERTANDEDREYDQIVYEHLEKYFGKEQMKDVEPNKRETVVVNWLVAVDMNFEEVSIMRDIDERSAFFRSLGPEFHDMEEAVDDFRSRCLQVLYPEK